MKKATKPRNLTKDEINAVAGGNSELQNIIGAGMAKGSGNMYELGDTVYFPSGTRITLGEPTIK